MGNNKDVTLYDVLKAVQGVDAKIEGVSKGLNEFRQATHERFDVLEQKVTESVNGTESLNQRVWNLEKQLSTSGKQKLKS